MTTEHDTTRSNRPVRVTPTQGLVRLGETGNQMAAPDRTDLSLHRPGARALTSAHGSLAEDRRVGVRLAATSALTEEPSHGSPCSGRAAAPRDPRRELCVH